MSDIFREVEEDVRRERLQKLWKAYGDYVIGAAVLVFALIAGFELWQRHEADAQAKAAAALTAAQRIVSPAQAADAYSTLAKDAPKGYALVARLAQANAMVASGQGKDALDLYRQIARDDDGPVGMVARLRAAWTMADSATRGELAQLLAPLDNQTGAWHALAREVLAYADYRALDLKSAQMKYALLAADRNAPEGLRARAHAMAAYISQGSGANYGIVPAPVAPIGTALPDPAAPSPAAPNPATPAQ